MTLVCYNRPNRSKPRTYSCADVRRITRYAIAAGVDPRCIVNEILQETGQAEAVCRVLSLVRIIRELKENAFYVAVLSALITIISGISAVLRRRGATIGGSTAGLRGVVSVAQSTAIGRVFRAVLDAIARTPIGQALIGLGIIQLILINIRELLDVWDDLIDPLLDFIFCE